MDRYVQSLMLADRPDRHGFPSEVATEIFRLASVLNDIGQREPVKTGAWDRALDNEFTRPKDR